MGALADRPLFYPARPTITVGGQGRPELGAAVASLTTTETTAGLYTLEAIFGNWGTHQGEVGYLYFDRALFDFGTEIAVDMGGGQAAGRVFSGRISALEGRYPAQRPPELLVLAEDRLQDLRMTPHTRAFEDTTTSKVVGTIATDHQLQAQFDAEDVSYAVVAQVNQSDLAFLRDLARAADGEVWVEAGALHVQGRGRRRGGEVRLTYGQTLHEFSVIADLAQQRTSVTVAGWDVTGKTELKEEATESAVQAELEGGESGPGLLGQKFRGTRPERIVHTVPLSQGEARTSAEARMRCLARRFVCGRGVAEGDARIHVGAKVVLGDLGPLFNGPYYVSEVRHSFDARNGYRTAFVAERPGLGGTP